MKSDFINPDSIDVILNNMRRKPEEWWMDRYHAKHRSGVSIWIGNGITNYHVQEPHYQAISWSNRLKLRKALKKLKEEMPSL
ncbi:MAG: hypothetical protein VW777_11135 [Deltaproteobacteria bacterium]